MVVAAMVVEATWTGWDLNDLTENKYLKKNIKLFFLLQFVGYIFC